MATGQQVTVVAMMPSVSTIVERMTAIDDTGSDVERFHRMFAQKIGGTQKNQSGVMMAWELTAYELARREGSIPFVFQLMALNYGRYMEALFPDNAEFAAACIECRKEVERMAANHE